MARFTILLAMIFTTAALADDPKVTVQAQGNNQGAQGTVTVQHTSGNVTTSASVTGNTNSGVTNANVSVTATTSPNTSVNVNAQVGQNAGVQATFTKRF